MRSYPKPVLKLNAKDEKNQAIVFNFTSIILYINHNIAKFVITKLIIMKCVPFKVLCIGGAITLLSIACNPKPKSDQQDHAEDKKAIVYTGADSAVLSYWDKIDMQDTAKIKDPNMGEQKLADFISALNSVSDTVADHAVARMLDKAKGNKVTFDHFIKLYEHYLYEGNSPMRNDNRYESVLRYLIKTDQLTDLEKEAYRPVYKLVQRNKVGQVAEDFSFETSNGKTQKLSDVKSKYTLLFFYDTECPHCKQMIAALKDTPQVVDLFEKKQIQMVTIEPWGDRTKWKNFQTHLAENWINGFDTESVIQKKRLYDTKASPTIYLLDADKKVILKDTELQQALQYVVQLT